MQYKTLEWTEIAILGALTVALGFFVEGAFLTGNAFASLTMFAPFLAGAIGFQHYHWEPFANRVSAMFVAAVVGMGLQVFAALIAVSLFS